MNLSDMPPRDWPAHLKAEIEEIMRQSDEQESASMAMLVGLLAGAALALVLLVGAMTII